MTALTYDFARTLAKGWHPGDEVVVTRLDHDANIRPWVQAAEQVGAVPRFADFDPASGALEAEHVEACLSDRTVLVAVTAASNLIGTVPPVPEIASLAHSRGALVFVDGVHRTPHLPVDRAELEADFYVCSPYKFCGPHCGVLAADPELLATLRPDKLLPATDEVPERFELGTLPYELLAGTTAAVDFLADVARLAGVSTASGSRRERLVESMQAVQAYEDGLRQRVESGLAGLAGVTLHGHATRRTPTLLFTVQGHNPDDLFNGLAASGVNAPAGSFYAVEASRHLGLGDDGGVRVGMAPYTSAQDVDRLLDGVAALV